MQPNPSQHKNLKFMKLLAGFENLYKDHDTSITQDHYLNVLTCRFLELTATDLQIDHILPVPAKDCVPSTKPQALLSGQTRIAVMKIKLNPMLILTKCTVRYTDSH